MSWLDDLLGTFDNQAPQSAGSSNLPDPNAGSGLLNYLNQFGQLLGGQPAQGQAQTQGGQLSSALMNLFNQPGASRPNGQLNALANLQYANPELYAPAYAGAMASSANYAQQLPEIQQKTALELATLQNNQDYKNQYLQILGQKADTQQSKVDAQLQAQAQQDAAERAILGGQAPQQQNSVPALSQIGQQSSNAPFVNRVMQAESGGNPNAVSSAGATGLMQLMPGTAANPGFGVTPAQDGSPQENVRVGSQYLGALTQKYGSEPLAAAAYNWGPGNVDKWLAQGADPNALPQETAQYVQKTTGTPPTALSQLATSSPPVTSDNSSALAQPAESPALAQLHQLAMVNPGKYAEKYATAALEAEKTQAKAASTDVPGDTTLQGSAYLGTVPDQNIRNKAQALLDGRAPFPTVTSRTPTDVATALRVAQQADPSYSAATAHVRTKTAQAYSAAGDQGKVLQSIGTASGHIADLKQAYDALNNTGFSPLNYLGNQTNALGNGPEGTALAKFNTALNAVAPELAKISAGTSVVPEGEISKRRGAFSPDMPPNQFNAAITEAASLIKSRSDNLIDAYQQTMGGNLPATAPKFSDKTLKNFKDLGVDLGGSEQSASPTNPIAAELARRGGQ